MIHALLPNRRDEPNDASSLAPSSLHGTSITANPVTEHGNSAVVYHHPSMDEILRSGRIGIDSYFGITTDNTLQETLPFTSRPISQTVKSTFADLVIAHRYYTIHTRQTLESLATVSVSKYKPPATMDRILRWSSRAPEESASPKKKGDLSADRQVVSFQRSRNGQGTHPHVSSGTTVDQSQDLGVKVLVLGISESGKSTLQHSMKIAFEDDHEQWRLLHKSDIYMSLESEEEDGSLEDCTQQ